MGSDQDKLTIDSSTGEITLNNSYSITESIDISPIINVVSNISGEVVSFENILNIRLSQTPEPIETSVNYFFYPSLKPKSKGNLAAGGDGYSRQNILVLNLNLGFTLKDFGGSVQERIHLMQFLQELKQVFLKTML